MVKPRDDGTILAAVLAVAVTTGFAPGWGVAQPPHPGEVQTLTVISLSLRVGSTENEARHVTYTPPPGWFVRGHAVHCTCRSGPSSYAISTVPANWAWFSEEKLCDRYQQLLEAAAQAHDAGLQTRLKYERDLRLHLLRQARASHHALVLDASARGEGFWRRGAVLELTVTAELVYVGLDEPTGEAPSEEVAACK